MKQMRSVLIVTGSYAPTMLADMHRARLLAWELPKLGWSVEIVAPDVEFQHRSAVDADSAPFFAPDVPVHAARPWLSFVFRALNMRSIGWRAFVPMATKGVSLLRSGRFDIVYITTAQFPLFLLGPLWRRLTGVPYLLDLHDPLYREEKSRYVTTRRGWKSHASRLLARFIGKRAVRSASGVISVSPDYLAGVRHWQRDARHAVIPFAGRAEDFDVVGERHAQSETHRLVYVGAGGPVMARALQALARALRCVFDRMPALRERLRIELYGTTLGWQSGDEKMLHRVACELGMGDVIHEFPGRVSYRRSLELLREASGLIVLGVDHAGYMPSKVYGYALSGKPLLAVLHERSPGRDAFLQCPDLGHVLWFGNQSDMPEEEAAKTMVAYLESACAGAQCDRRAELQPVLAPAMACRHARFFEQCLKGRAP